MYEYRPYWLVAMHETKLDERGKELLHLCRRGLTEKLITRCRNDIKRYHGGIKMRHNEHVNQLARFILGEEVPALHYAWNHRPYWLDLLGVVAGYDMPGPTNEPLTLTQAVSNYLWYYR